MPDRSETIAPCHSCGSLMDVSAVAPFSEVECHACGKRTWVKRGFGPYTLVRRHAVGGMSMVFVAHDPTLDREVALKILSEDFSTDERRIKAFEEEARLTASFNHPHVVRVLTTGKAFGRFYIAMEFVPGGHFEDQILERGKIPELEMLPLAIEVAQGLKAAHAAGLIHRDVKPGNILLDAQGHAKLVDFGLALVTHGGKAWATELWATTYYVPPETIEGDAEDFRSDIYAFGATLYHALSGKPSCGEESMATDILREAKKKVVPLGVADSSLSAAVCKIVDRAMAHDPKDRFSSYDEMIALLESTLLGLKLDAPAAAERRAKKQRVKMITLALAVLVMLAALSTGIRWISRRETQVVSKPVVPVSAPVIPEPAATPDTGIAKSYHEARAAVEARDFTKAADMFAQLRENPSVQEPTRTWAGVEAVAVAYLDGRSSDAGNLAKAAASHALTVPEKTRIGDALIRMLDRLQELPTIPAKELDASRSDPPHVMAWMLAGLKNWEQGTPSEAVGYFSAVASAKIAAEDGWLAIYQTLAGDYLADQRTLSGALFEKLPADTAGCEAAVAELEGILSGLKTRGRARYNVRAWQLDLVKHAKLLAAPAIIESAAPDLATVMAKLGGFAADCRFTEASTFLKSLPSDPPGARRASLIAVSEAAAALLAGLEQDLRQQAATGGFFLKSGEAVVKIAINSTGVIVVTDAKGKARSAAWGDFSADAVIELHRIFVKNAKTEMERLQRHESAISYDWLAGNRGRALVAAAVLSRESPAFKQRWEAIASGLPQ